MDTEKTGIKINDFRNTDYLNAKLRLHKKRTTRLGSVLYGLLLENKTPLCAADIYKSLKVKVNLSSVYRTLKKFLELGLIFEENIGKESFYYISDKHHHHIICEKCGYIKCIPCMTDFSGIDNFTDITHELILKGICNDCSKTCKP